MPPLDQIPESDDVPKAESRIRSTARQQRPCYATNSLLEPDTADPDLQLRIVRSATESIHEAAKEDERRRIGKRRKRRDTLKSTFLGTIKRAQRAPSNASSTLKEEKSSSNNNAGALDPAAAANQQQDAALAKRASRFYQDEEQTAKAENFVEAKPGQSGTPEKGAESRRRRNVHVNVDLSPLELDKRGQPLARYARNKVRTFKYTLFTFLPKNLTEQFRRAANIFFAALVVLQLFPIFGGSSAGVAALPLISILVITGVKDGIEDYRRHALDRDVNNSAATVLASWHNVNQPTDRRNFLQRALGLDPPKPRVSKGVRKLRQREGDFSTEFLKNNNSKSTAELNAFPTLPFQASEQHIRATPAANNDAKLEVLDDGESAYAASVEGDRLAPLQRQRSYTIASSTVAPSAREGTGELGVVDYSRQAPGTAHWERTLWKKVEVGDIVLLKENDPIPADLLVLSTSDQDGACFVETKNLDGETNLKPRRCLRATMGIQAEEDIEHAKFILDSEPAHANLYAYSAILRYWQRDAKGVPGVEKTEAVTINELLLRGCSLRNTQWVIGLVVFTGADTKIMLNQGATPSKRSKIEHETNFNVLANFVILMIICLACAIADGYFTSSVVTSGNFYEPGNDGSSNVILASLITLGATLILFQNIVPIALVISIEMVKSIQAYFIYSDLDMYYEPLDHPCVPKSWNISDDLGQIEYIFSDKTGTLTQNVMDFMKCSINGVKYGEGVTEASKGAAVREGRENSALEPVAQQAELDSMKTTMVSELQRLFKNPLMQPEELTLIAPQLPADLSDRSSEQRNYIVSFFRALALCHTVLADRSDTTKPNLIKYKAESPDEAALVSAARDVGFPFLARTSLEMDIEVMGQRERWTPLRTLEFNSTRKRMSVVLRSPEGRLLLICKGADTVIYQRLRADQDPAMKEKTTQDLEDFANGGLRTLCIAQRSLTETEFAEWSRQYDAACAAVEEREEEMEKACELVERDLTLLGATALEDKLQVGVPDAIEKLHEAGIKLWILTGDKLQTAIEIGFSCNLLKPAMDILIISADSEAGARAQIESGLAKVHSDLAAAGNGAAHTEHAVVIDGETLRSALADDLKPLFLELTTRCETVVCCRVSPAQKAQTVKLVKDGKKAMTLAIGDGANDVAMIQEANVGVGIAGLEGAQASMCADYAVGQFRYLQKLLLVHGRWCYKRVALFHCVFFYKSMAWTFPLFWYQFYCSFNASLVFDYSFLMLFSIIFTSLPVILQGAFDQDVDATTSLRYPILYRRGIAGLEYTRTMFFAFILDGLYQSAICFFVPYLVYSYSTTTSITGRNSDSVAELGTTIAIATIMAANTFTAMMTRYWTKLFVLITLISTLTVFLWTAIYSTFPYGLLNIMVELFSTSSFYFILILVQILCLLPHFLYLYVQNTYFPQDVDIIRELRLARGHAASAHYKKDDRDLPSAISLPESPPLPASRVPSYASAVAPHGSSSAEATPTLRAPTHGDTGTPATTPPLALTPPMEGWHSPSTVWHSPESQHVEMSEYIHGPQEAHRRPDSGLSRQPSTQSFASFRSTDQNTAPGYAL